LRTGRPAFEEYRYDALGRRVWVRSRPEWACAGNCSAAVRRTIWDGDQILYEIRAPGGTGKGALMEKDTGLAVAFPATTYAYGRVMYTHGGGLDQPLSFTRMEFSDRLHAPVTIIPLSTWNGSYDTGVGVQCTSVVQDSATLEQPVDDYPTGNGDNPRPPIGFNGGGTVEHCTTVDWPSAYMWQSKLSRPRSALGPSSWMGSLIEEGKDPSGQLYMRNRYYDPQSGRFTQEDPIGIAGGLNVYGFAGGDPVNYSDPYGLCPTPNGEDDGKPCELGDIQQAHGF
jgi:RHS repeat-associated protein